MTKNIYIYNDFGVGAFSLHAIKEYFSSEKVTLISAQEVIDFGIPDDAYIFVMPGGADRPYAQKLNGAGNRNIKKYVERGGIYLGICAGAYYGCSEIQFQKDTPNEICEDRELGFFQGLAIGCLPEIAETYDQTLKSASVTEIEINNSCKNVFYWGGCYFQEGQDSNLNVVARYKDIKEKSAAIISCSYGEGVAILSGVHFEVFDKVIEEYDFENIADNEIKKNLIGKLNRVNLTDIAGDRVKV